VGRPIEAGLMLAMRIMMSVSQISNLVTGFPGGSFTTVKVFGGGN